MVQNKSTYFIALTSFQKCELMRLQTTASKAMKNWWCLEKTWKNLHNSQKQ